MYLRLSIVTALLAITACGRSQPGDTPAANANEFMTRLAAYCGAAYEGRIVSDDPEDDAWRTETIVADIAACSEDEVIIPLHVGDDRSRTWIIRQRDSGTLSLHHQHNHEDGAPDALTMYGGNATSDSSGSRQNFPADEETKALFDREGIPVSKQNVWAIEVHPARDMLAYEMKRPERFFRIEFDLSQPVADPPAPW